MIKFILLVPLALLLSSCCEVTIATTEEDVAQLLEAVEKLNEKVERSKESLGILGRQTMLQQLYIEEQTRSSGDSGIKGIRLQNTGARPYHSDTFSYYNKAASVHSHDNHIRTIGTGELIVVVNGVEFRSRHNDYKLEQPSTTDTTYNQVEEIPYPPVPDSVLEKSTVQDQIEEMREYFRAFKLQDPTIRDYKNYFKPVLSYIEGAWTTNTEDIIDSFESDRHFIDASSWQDLQQKIRFTAYTGAKDTKENYAYLPTMILNVTDDGTPILAQWSYRILCHQLTEDVPLNRFRPVDDLSTRMSIGYNMYQWPDQTAARFQLNVDDQDEWISQNMYPTVQYLDKLMHQIPGKDNYGSYIEDDIFNVKAYHYGTNFQKVLNVGYYHRVYQVNVKDAMGISLRRRGYNDANIFMAENTREEIAPMSVYWCNKFKNEDGKKVKECYTFTKRYSYAIPFEIIYLTPIPNWNPYNISYWGIVNSEAAKAVTKDGRDGDSKDKAYNGTDSKHFYQTPAEFYLDTDSEGDPADTSGTKWVLDSEGVAHQCMSSGIRVRFPKIEGIGRVRQRYPIFPVHEEGSTTYKNVEALADMVMEPHNYTQMFRGHYNRDRPEDTYYTLKLGTSNPKKNGGSHEHYIYLTKHDLDTMFMDGEKVKKLTTFNFGPDDTYDTGHRHALVLVGNIKQKQATIKYVKCDDQDENKLCEEGHNKQLIADNIEGDDKWQIDASKWPDKMSPTDEVDTSS